MARVDTLPEGTKALLQTGAVVERQFSFNLISEVMKVPEQELLSHVLLLKASGLLDETGAPTQPTYAFRHTLYPRCHLRFHISCEEDGPS